MLRFLLRALGHMFLWTIVKGSVSDGMRRTDPRERLRIYTYIALCVLGVILLSNL